MYILLKKKKRYNYKIMNDMKYIINVYYCLNI